MGRHINWYQRFRVPFRAVNRRGTREHDPALQRHHLLPRQLLNRKCFGSLFAVLGGERVGFDDFRTNGMLLPCSEVAAQRTALPLHRGPHRDYNSMVIERVGEIEARWAALRLSDGETAGRAAIDQLHALQKALRKQLLDDTRPITLNRKDPIGTGVDFSELDEMVEVLWAAAA